MKFAVILTLALGLILIKEDRTVAQKPKTSGVVVTGRVTNNIGDFSPAAPIGSRASFPAANRSVFIFEGIHKTIYLDQPAYKVVKTDKTGKFKIKLKSTVYTFAILVHDKFVTGVKRKDGYMPFVDCLKNKQYNVKLIDNSQAQF